MRRGVHGYTLATGHGRCRLFASLLGLVIAAIPWVPAAHNAATATETLASRPTLTEDWSGRRTTLVPPGIEIGIGHYVEVMAVADGGEARSTYYSGLIEVGLEFDLATLLDWPDTRAVVLGIGTFGRDTADGAGSIHAPATWLTSRPWTARATRTSPMEYRST